MGSAGVERYLEIPQLASGAVILTNGQRLASEVIGEHVMALTRALARGLNRAVGAQLAGQWQRSEIGDNAPLTKLRGKTLLVVGLGGIGTEVARLADGAGMRVTAILGARRGIVSEGPREGQVRVRVVGPEGSQGGRRQVPNHPNDPGPRHQDGSQPELQRQQRVGVDNPTRAAMVTGISCDWSAAVVSLRLSVLHPSTKA